MPRLNIFIYSSCSDFIHELKLLQYLYFDSQFLQKKFENLCKTKADPGSG